MRILLIVALSFLLSHCSFLFPEVKKFPPPPAIELPVEQVASLVRTLQMKFDQIKNFRVLSDVELDSADEAHELRYVIVVDSEKNRMRVDVLAPATALTLQLIVVKDDFAKALLLQDKVAYEGKFQPATLKMLFGIEADLQTLLSYLTATLSPSAGIRFRGFRAPGSQNVSLYSEDGKVFLLYDISQNAVSQFMIRESADASVELVVDYLQDSKSAEGMNLPSTVRLNLLEEDIRARVRYKTIKLNTGLNDLLFDIEVPSDYSLRDLP